jgi:hypothetical protein
MNITVNKIQRELKEKYGWQFLGSGQMEQSINDIIKDTLKIVDTELIKHKNISIKK